MLRRLLVPRRRRADKHGRRDMMTQLAEYNLQDRALPRTASSSANAIPDLVSTSARPKERKVLTAAADASTSGELGVNAPGCSGVAFLDDGVTLKSHIIEPLD